MEALNCRVNELQQENAELRAQRAKLKLLLIQHRDCDVTRGLKRECSVGRGSPVTLRGAGRQSPGLRRRPDSPAAGCLVQAAGLQSAPGSLGPGAPFAVRAAAALIRALSAELVISAEFIVRLSGQSSDNGSTDDFEVPSALGRLLCVLFWHITLEEVISPM